MDRLSHASEISWPVTDLARAVELLARGSGLRPQSGLPLCAPPHDIGASREALERWVVQICKRLGIEAERAEIVYGDVERRLCQAGPALLTVPGPHGPSFLALVQGGRRAAVLLGRDGRRHRVRASELAAWLRCEVESPLVPAVQTLLAEAGLPPARRHRAGLAILRDRFASASIAPCWLLRLRPEAPFWQHIRQALLVRHIWIIAIAVLVHACVWVASWWIIGRAAMEGRFDSGALLAWVFLLLLLVPLSIFVAWSQGVFAIGAGGLLKLRLLVGALQLGPDETRHQGAGHHFARVMESEALESMTLASGFSALATVVELLIAAAIFIAASQDAALALLAATVVMTSILGWYYFKRRQQWTDARRTMTQDLVERMVGHRTRLAGEPHLRWHEGEDELLEHYFVLSARMDRIDQALMAVPRCWLIMGLIALAPSFVTAQGSPGMLAAALGGVLLAFGALTRLTSTSAFIAAAALAWKQIKPLLDAARRPDLVGCAEPALVPAGPLRTDSVLTAKDVGFRFPDRHEPVLHGCTFRISHGDRIHLSGRSGSGKSTLVSLLTGLRTPTGGILLIDGLDRATLGADGWRRRVVAAPQFHENYVFSESLAFNLLMGRRWPAQPEDLELAEAVCRRLGLGDLIDRMPAGLFQPVGETGWQLSHGERSRLFMARALLQGADFVVFDESFAELDPESLRHCLTEVANLSDTLLVVGHA